MKKAEKQWKSVAKGIANMKQRRKVVNLFKSLYILTASEGGTGESQQNQRSAPSIQLSQWNKNPIAKQRKPSMWRLCTDEATGKAFYVNDTTKERRFSIPVDQQVMV